MAALAGAFPIVIVALVVLVLILAVRLDRRLSRNAYSAGPVDAERPTPVGLTQTPWELQGIEDQLTRSGWDSRAVPHYDLTATVNRLISAAGLQDPRHRLPATADRAALELAITRIEHQLGLPPLDGGPEPGRRPAARGR